MNYHKAQKLVVYVLLYALTGALIISSFYLPAIGNHSFPILRATIIFFASIFLLKYCIYMLVSPWYEVATALKYRDLESSSRPKVSVIIPAWNEEVGILATIKTLLRSSYRNLEIVIINDGSTDRSDFIIREFIAQYEREHSVAGEGIRIRYQYKQNEGKGAALNAGIRMAVGDIIISIDADCVVREDTVANFVKYFRDPKVMAAVGNVKIGNTNTLIGVIQHLEFLFSFYFKKADSLFSTIYIIGGAAGAFRRKVFEDIGLYSTTSITEDIDLSVRIQDAGMKIVYASDAVVYTEGATDLAGLMKQRLRWKRGRFETFNDHRHLFFSLRQRHSKLLTWLVMPFSIFSETTIFFEVFFLAFLYAYSFLTHDFSSFISGIVVVSSIFFVQIFCDGRESRKLPLYLLAPIGWLLFYVATFVEYNALVRSIWGYYRNKEVKWQKWQRSGVIDNSQVSLSEA
jgi:biofilm PGA synthesis N-glycosyltransferase PgaC